MEESKPIRLLLPRSLVAVLLCALSAGCGGFYGTTAASYLRRVNENPDPNDRYRAYELLASPRCYDSEDQKARAVEVMTEKLQGDAEPVATKAIICRTLGQLGDPRAREAVRRLTEDSDPMLRAEAYRTLGKIGSAEDAVRLASRMTTDIQLECRIAAAEGIGFLKTNDPRIYDTLLLGMEHDDPAIRLASLEALKSITKKDLGVETEPWRNYLARTAPLPSAGENAPATAGLPTLPSDPATRRTSR